MSLHVEQFTMTVWVPVGDIPPPVEAPVTRTMRFAAGTTGNRWYVVAAIVDSGNELRSKQLKSARITGKVTDCNLQLYTWDVLSAIDVGALEAGTGSATGNIPSPDTTDVVQSARYNVNCANAVLHTMRADGIWIGDDPPDRVDEMVYEVSGQGVRR
jgi:hypothetical protein